MAAAAGWRSTPATTRPFDHRPPIACRAETVEAEDDDEYEDVDAGAFVVVRRKLANPQLQVGKMTTVTVEVHNTGKR